MSDHADKISAERERRHWTIAEWKDEYGNDWPRESAQVRMEADHAVDVLLAENERLREERDDWKLEAGFLKVEIDRLREALEKGKRFERAYQESLGATPTTPQWESLESLQSAFIDAYVDALRAAEEAE